MIPIGLKTIKNDVQYSLAIIVVSNSILNDLRRLF